MSMGRWYLEGLVLATVFLFAFSNLLGMIATSEEYEPQGGLYGGELRVALKDDIEENPLLAQDDASLFAVSLLYDSLARIDEVSLLAEPWVAVNWSLTTNTTVDVNIRTNVEWHDSTDENPHYLTVDDIVYTFNSSQGMKSSAHWGSMLTNVLCWGVDENTVRFDLSNAEEIRGVFLNKILTIPIIPNGFTATSEESGSGPYRFGTRGTHSYVLANQVVVKNAVEGQVLAVAAVHYHYIGDSKYDSLSPTLYRNDVEMSPSEYEYIPWNGTVRFASPLQAGDNITANYSITSRYTTLLAFEKHFYRRPYLDSINYTFYPDDPATEFDESTDGAMKAMVDSVIDFIGFPLVEGSQNAVRWEGGTAQTQLSDKAHTHVFVQTTNPRFSFLYLGMNTEVTPLNDPLFRKGVTMSVKRELALNFESTAMIADCVIHPRNIYWYNESCPKFRVPKDENNNPIYTQIINHFQDSGYLDPDEDGYMETPTGENFTLRLFVPPTAEDPNKAAIGADIGETFRDVGIDTETISLERDRMMEEVRKGNFSFYLTTYDVEADPIFLYDILHPRGSRNYARLDDPVLNGILENVSGQLNQETRRFYVRYALGWIAENAPIVSILHYKVLETFEGVRFEGWVQMPGGVNNFWSYLQVHYKQKGRMKAQVILYVDSVRSGETLEVYVLATDLEDYPLQGAWIKLTNSYSDELYTNYTGSDGIVKMDWLAPVVSQVTTVTFTATVRIPQYEEEIVTGSITLHPRVSELDVTIAIVGERTIGSGETAEVVVEVKDGFSLATIQNATVLITVSPEGAGGNLDEYSGTTDAAGQFRTTFRGEVSTSTQFNLRATASKEGYEAADSQPTSILVMPKPGPTPGFEAIIVAVVILLAVIILFVWIRIRSKKVEE